MSEVICPTCNTANVVGAVFCDNCGASLQNVAPATPAQPAQSWQPEPPAAGGPICPNCNFQNVAGAAFCENCGTPLAGQAQVPQPGSPQAPIQPPTSPSSSQPSAFPDSGFVTGRVVIQGSNASLSFPPGKQVIVFGREDPVSGIFPEIDLDPHGGHDAGVGRKHAQLIVVGGQVSLEDLNSVNGTWINKQKLVAGQRMPLNNGDEIRLGKLVLSYYSS